MPNKNLPRYEDTLPMDDAPPRYEDSLPLEPAAEDSWFERTNNKYDEFMNDAPIALQALDPKAIGAFGNQIGRSIPIVGPLAAKAGNRVNAGLQSLASRKSYSDLLDEITKEDELEQAQIRAKYPKAAMAGSFASGTVVPPVGGIMANAAVSGIDSAARAKDGQRLAEGIKGAAIAGAFGGALKGIDKTGKFFGSLKERAEDAAFDATGAMKADYKDLFHGAGHDMDTMVAKKREIGRELLDSGSVKFGDDVSDIVGRVQSTKAGVDDNIGSLLREIDKNPARQDFIKQAQNGRKMLAQELETATDPSVIRELEIEIQKVDDFLSYTMFDRSKSADAFRDIAKDHVVDGRSFRAARGNMIGEADELDDMARFTTLEEGNRLKSTFGRATGNMSEDNFTRELREKGYHKLKDQMEDTVKMGSTVNQGIDEGLVAKFGIGQEAQESFTKLNNRSHLLHIAEDASVNRGLGNMANRKDSLTDYASGGMGAGIGATIGGMIAGPMGVLIGGHAGKEVGMMGNKIYRSQSNSMKATTYDWVYQKIKNDPMSLGKYSKPLLEAAKRGNAALSATHFLLSQQDPEYRKMTGEGK